MFDFVHENKKLVQIFFALITLPFVVWGVSSYESSGTQSQSVASVGGTEITQQELENVLRMQQERIRRQMGANFDPAILDNPEMKRAALDTLITQRLLQAQAKTAHLVVTDERIAQVIASIEAFQVAGKFDKARYEEVLRGENMTPLIFEARLRDEFIGQQIQDAYTQNGYAANVVAEDVLRLNRQKRTVSIAQVELQAFMPQLKVGDDAIKEYYEKNETEFQIKEQARVEYAKLSVDDLLAKAEISKDEVLQYYDSHQTDFGTAEERQASHILITVAPTAPQAEQDAAKSKAESLLQQLKKAPAKFAELAKANSQDPGSAVKGGDLGYFGRGMMVKPFEDAAFALKNGEISELVRSDFGYHIIKLTGIKAARVLPFDEAREGIANKLRQQKAADMFAGLAEKFSNTVYEQSDTLKTAAELAGIKVEQSGWLRNDASTPDPLWTPKMLQTIFTDDVIKRKRNSAAIEIAPNVLVAARLLEYKPASVSALSEVQEVIHQKLERSQALELAVKQGNEVLGQLQAGSKPALHWGGMHEVTRGKHEPMDVTLMRQVFQADVAKLPQFVGSETAAGYMIVRVDAVKDGETASETDRQNFARQLRRLTGEAMFQAYLADARQHAKIKVNLPDTTNP
jgi:peptidyl-prolyl cis-trans isomerase D